MEIVSAFGWRKGVLAHLLLTSLQEKKFALGVKCHFGSSMLKPFYGCSVPLPFKACALPWPWGAGQRVKRLQVRFLKEFVGVHSQVSCVQVEGWALGNFYAPPGTGAAAEVEVCEALNNTMLEFPTEFKQWIWCGDANEIACDSNIASLGAAHSGTVLSTGLERKMA